MDLVIIFSSFAIGLFIGIVVTKMFTYISTKEIGTLFIIKEEEKAFIGLNKINFGTLRDGNYASFCIKELHLPKEEVQEKQPL